MTALYNEIDPFAAEWLRQLIKQGHIADGIVDERSIEDLEPDYVSTFTQVHFFAGIGVWSHALRNAGWRDETPVWTGSCPCQPFSAAGKGNGFDDERHLWPAMHWLIEQCKPDIVFGEQVASKDGLAWLDIVSSDLEGSGYAAGAADTCAAGFGAPHIRQRLYWCGTKRMGNASEPAFERIAGSLSGAQETVDGTGVGVDGIVDFGFEHAGSSLGERPGPTSGFWANPDWLGCRDGKWRAVEPGTFPLAHGAPARVGRLRGYGNAIVAPQAQAFIESYMECN